MNLQEIRKSIIAESFIQNDLEKGAKANIGEIREWQGKKYQKTPQGWKMSESVHQGGKKSISNLRVDAEEKRKNPWKDSKIVEHEGKFYLKRGDYFLTKEGKGYVTPDPNFSFPTREKAENFISDSKQETPKKEENFKIGSKTVSDNVQKLLNRKIKEVVDLYDYSPYEIPAKDTGDAVNRFSKLVEITPEEVDFLDRMGFIKMGIKNLKNELYFTFSFPKTKLKSLKEYSLQKAEALDILGINQEEILKGAKANIGEVREWLGQKYQKQANGEWKKIGSNNEQVKKDTKHLDTLSPKTPPTQEELKKRADEEAKRRKEQKDQVKRRSLDLKEMKINLGELRDKMWEADGNLQDAKYDLKGLKEDLQNLKEDMESEAGEKGDKWSDDDANQYGSQMNKVESQIEKQKKLITQLEKKSESARNSFNSLESRIWKQEEKPKSNLSKSEALDILGINQEEIFKAKRANIGEIREWNGKKYKKTVNGNWMYISDPSEDTPKAEESKTHSHKGKEYKKNWRGNWIETSKDGLTREEHRDKANSIFHKLEKLRDEGTFSGEEVSKLSEERKNHMDNYNKLSGAEYTDKQVGLKK